MEQREHTMAPPPTPVQVFIVGPARCGTSIMVRLVRMLLDKDYHSLDEGHLLDILPALDDCVDDFLLRRKPYYRTFDNMTVSHAAPERLKAAIQDGVIGVNAEILGSSRLIDKTHGPDMVWALPALRDRLPQSRAIFLRRRFNEYMRSAMLKFPFWSFEEKLEHWCATINAWRVVRRQVGDYCLDIEHMAMVNEPGETALRILRHLAKPESRADTVVDYLRRHTPERTPGGSYSPVSLDEIGLTPEQLRLARRKIHWLNREFGYGYENDAYFAR